MAWLCVSAAMAVVGLVNGVFVMIQELCTGEFYVESGGITVYFVSACRSDNFGRPYHLLGRGGDVVASIFADAKGSASRVRELKKAGLLK